MGLPTANQLAHTAPGNHGAVHQLTERGRDVRSGSQGKARTSRTDTVSEGEPRHGPPMSSLPPMGVGTGPGTRVARPSDRCAGYQGRQKTWSGGDGWEGSLGQRPRAGRPHIARTMCEREP